MGAAEEQRGLCMVRHMEYTKYGAYDEFAPKSAILSNNKSKS